MKTVILSVNSRYIHTLLAPRYLKANSRGFDVEVMETNVNIRPFDVISELYRRRPDVVAISCYIFNIEYLKALLPEIRTLMPHIRIILGGYEALPELSNLCDFIVRGEGDLVFRQILKDIAEGKSALPKIIDAGYVEDLDRIASPFDEEYCLMGKDRILYMETSRGCPFSCSYCMSAGTPGVRAFSLERVFSDIDFVMKFSPRQIKFVDRTFNYDMKRAAKIFSYLIERYSGSGTNFHFEMTPELFDERLFEVLRQAQPGLFQFEIGIQSFNEQTLKGVKRHYELKRAEENIKRLIQTGNIHIHADLIAGLPFEDLKSFKEGFDRLMEARPHCLQLGFLKILKGSGIEQMKDCYAVQNRAPYEIYGSKWLSFDDILELKEVEDMLNLYYNSGRFKKSIGLLLGKFPPYGLFYALAQFYKKRGAHRKNLSAKAHCDMLYAFAESAFSQDRDFLEQLKEYINEDYLSSGNLRKWIRD